MAYVYSHARLTDDFGYKFIAARLTEYEAGAAWPTDAVAYRSSAPCPTDAVGYELGTAWPIRCCGVQSPFLCSPHMLWVRSSTLHRPQMVAGYKSGM